MVALRAVYVLGNRNERSLTHRPLQEHIQFVELKRCTAAGLAVGGRGPL
jgi:hypothetical protein